MEEQNPNVPQVATPSTPAQPMNGGDTDMPDVNANTNSVAAPVVATAAAATTNPQFPQPTLGRHASAGDQQPVLVQRQISDLATTAPPGLVVAPAPAAPDATADATAVNSTMTTNNVLKKVDALPAAQNAAADFAKSLTPLADESSAPMNGVEEPTTAPTIQPSVPTVNTQPQQQPPLNTTSVNPAPTTTGTTTTATTVPGEIPLSAPPPVATGTGLDISAASVPTDTTASTQVPGTTLPEKSIIAPPVTAPGPVGPPPAMSSVDGASSGPQIPPTREPKKAKDEPATAPAAAEKPPGALISTPSLPVVNKTETSTQQATLPAVPRTVAAQVPQNAPVEKTHVNNEDAMQVDPPAPTPPSVQPSTTAQTQQSVAANQAKLPASTPASSGATAATSVNKPPAATLEKQSMAAHPMVPPSVPVPAPAPQTFVHPMHQQPLGPTTTTTTTATLARLPPPPVAAAQAPAPAPSAIPGMKELKVEDALLYLDDVKREFGNRPRVYNEFLAIMKNFKSQEVDTPGVIARVSKLFRGYNNLILGFNKFLPEGFKISLEDLEEADARYALEQEELKRHADIQMQQLSQPPSQKVISAVQPPAPSFQSKAPPRPVGAQPTFSVETATGGPVGAPAGLGVAHGFATAPAPKKASPPAAQFSPQAQAPAPQQAVEFDHAISYVTTIKRRFANDPSTYHTFLEILHTYQKEQRGIKEVLEQVAHLFQDHPDLLKEFTFFLPDAVQEQAKERLHRAAADSEARLAAARRAQVDPKVVDMTEQEASIRNRKRKMEAEVSSPPPIMLPQQPESYVYNSAVERQFFDTAREALAAYTRDGGQAWSEFLKCLDMYAQEILSRSEMFNFVEPLLGKRNNKLFEEFKRIINYAGAQASQQQQHQPNHEDSWYSVPLSEIDFSRCRRCSPSYRALPRDYPSPPCSDRSEEERVVLNDVWVSLPVGSEESYTFRHMRRNTFEETLFRVEDERFEIDMVIDSNAVTLARIEPIAEEIAQLAENELILPETDSQPRPASADLGLAGKRFHYTFDKTILGVIHRNSISRIYGDHGQEMLDLMVKNPTVAIPLVVERLRQKDQEWRKARARLNRQWKNLAEHNYFKSLDHRSLTWRTTDKRAISTRTLIAEIKDRAANNGKESSAALQVRLDKAKEEFGMFFQVTKGKAFDRQLDLANLPKPDRRLFTPHMSFMYENTNWVHQDAYRILTFALERGSTSPADKERCHRLWFDFLGPWFKLSMDWMMNPAVTYQENTKINAASDIPRVVSNGNDSMADDDDEDSDSDIAARVVTEDVRQIKQSQDSPSHMDHHPLPAGATVSTVYGDGIVISCRRSDDTYLVQLPFGKAFLRPSAVLCSILPAEKSAYTTKLRDYDRTELSRSGDMLAIGTQSLYLFFRLHQIFVRRLGIARQLAYSVKDEPSLINMVEQMPGEDAAALGKRRYEAYLSLVFALLDGGTTGTATDGGKYEDRVRALLGHGGYELATMDKLISHILKNLQNMANDDTMWNLVQLYRRHMASGSFKPEAFRMEAGYLSDNEQMYAFQMCPIQKDKNDKAVLHMEYLGVVAEDGSEAIANIAESQVPKRQKRER